MFLFGSPWRRWFGRLLTAAVIVAGAGIAPRDASPAAAAAHPAVSVPIVKTTTGYVSGKFIAGVNARRNMQAYLGIPYAFSPSGARRWLPPIAHPAWSGVVAATGFGAHCPQNGATLGVASEDCLHVNVFEPVGTTASSNLPVMVWIHGGAYTTGQSDTFDPDPLVERGVIVVTLNYRLGYLGILATSGLDAEAHTHVNYGLLDQQFALKWVHANIAAFGGNPANTTVFGESAGGSSTWAQLLSPGSSGLFHQAIIESGAYDVLTLPSVATAETLGNGVAAAAGCAPTNTACLRALPLSTLLAVQAASVSAFGLNPAIDGVFLPADPVAALETGNYNHVPVFQGTNHDEFRLFTAILFDLTANGPLTAAEYPAAVTSILATSGLSGYASEVLAKYPLVNYPSPDLAYSALVTDAIFSTPAYITNALLAARTPVYAYEFSDENAPEILLPPVSFPYGAAHGSELQYIFDIVTGAAPPAYTLAQDQLKLTMAGYWTHFATNAVPNATAAPLVPRYNPLLDDVVSLVPPTPTLFTAFATEHNTLFWSAILAGAAAKAGATGPKPAITLESVRAAVRALRPGARI